MSSYDEWNDAIACHFFHKQFSGQVVVLCVDAESLRSAWNGRFPNAELETPNDAQEEFVAAVRRHLDSFQQGANGSDFWFSGSTPKHQVPRQMGLLAIQVLAAMQVEPNDGTDDASWQASYWPKLHRLLNQEVDPGSPPIGLGYQMHQDMWRDVERWANQKNDGQLGRLQLPPATGTTAFRHIRLPLSQALLGPRDLSKLFVEVQKAELPNSGEPSVSAAQVKAWLSDSDLNLTAQTLRVFADSSRVAFACQQVVDAWPRRKDYENDGQRLRRRSQRTRSPRQCEIELVIEDQTQDHPAGGHHAQKLKMYVVANPHSGHPERRELTDEEKTEWLRNANISEQEFADLGVTFHAQAGALVAVASRSLQRFRTGTRLRPGRTALLLCHKVAYQPLAPGGVGWKQSLEDCCENIDRYCAGWPHESAFTSLAGIPNDHVLLKFTVRPDLEPGIELRGRWQEILQTAWQPIELAGGLLLSRRIWMRGAAPVVRVTDHKRVTALRFDDADFICPPSGRLIDELLDENKRAFQLRAERETGTSSGIRLRIRPPRYNGAQAKAKGVGWVLGDSGWAVADELSDDTQPAVRGLLVTGELLPPEPDVSRVILQKASREQMAITAMTSRWNKLQLGRATTVFPPRKYLR
ncbi:MAG: hypothetical protein R3C49_00270 [Planctomycetaceae bacterium]